MQVLVRAENLVKWFPVRRGFSPRLWGGRQLYVRAVDSLSFDVLGGRVVGLVGESGCGKTTTGKLLLLLMEPTSGRILFESSDIQLLKAPELKKLRRRMQMIFQDPYESLNPRKTVYEITSEPLKVHGILEGNQREEVVLKTLEAVQLAPLPDLMYKYPHELSGGQRQRVAIARALILQPDFVVADEPVSMLDVSIRMEVLNLMLDLKQQFKLTYFLITHDLAVAKYMCDEIAVMYLGKIVEIGPAESVIDDPRHPYTKALLAAVPVPDPTVGIGKIPIKGEIANPVDVPAGCRFNPRCPYAMKICLEKEPPLLEADKKRLAACYLVK